MRRLLQSMRLDLRLQFRYRLVPAAALLATVALIGLPRIPEVARDSFLILFLYGYAVFCGFDPCAALVLGERREGSLDMLQASPLRPHEYLAAKIASLSALPVLAGLAVALACRSVHFQPLPLLAGMGAGTALSALAGFLVASRHGTRRSFAAWSPLWALGLGAPLLSMLGFGRLAGIQAAWFFWHPLQGALSLLQAAFREPPGWVIAYGVGSSLLWAGIALWLGKRALGRMRESPGRP